MLLCPRPSRLNHPVPVHADNRGPSDLGLTVLVLMAVNDHLRLGPVDVVGQCVKALANAVRVVVMPRGELWVMRISTGEKSAGDGATQLGRRGMRRVTCTSSSRSARRCAGSGMSVPPVHPTVVPPAVPMPVHQHPLKLRPCACGGVDGMPHSSTLACRGDGGDIHADCMLCPPPSKM